MKTLLCVAQIYTLVSLTACQAAEPEPLVQSAEQAVTQFVAARDAQLKRALSEKQLRNIDSYTVLAESLRIWRLTPRDYQSPRNAKLTSDGRTPIFGTFAALAHVKHNTWRLYYSTPFASALIVYLDATTAEVLFIAEHEI